MKSLASICLVCIVLFVGMVPGAPVEDTRSLSGTVVTSTGQPLTSAYVTLLAMTPEEHAIDGQSSDVNGKYSFLFLQAGLYKITASARGQETRSIDVDLREAAAANVSHDVTLTSARALKRNRFRPVQIYFTTDRSNALSDPSEAFANDISGDGISKPISMTYGKLIVDVPIEKKPVPNGSTSLAQEIEQLGQFIFRWDAADIPVIEDASVQKLAKSDFFAALDSKLKEVRQGDALVFIHGYNVSFDDAARTAAELSDSLKRFHGPTILYSWSSHKRVDLYFPDKRNNDLTKDSLRTFLLDLAKQPSISRIDIIAHSMGNQALADVLVDLAREHRRENLKLGEIILAAPDVDAALFEQHGREIAGLARRVTLYASHEDWALKASLAAWHSYRTGNSDPPLVVPPVETIDATKARTDLLGHGYFLSNAEIAKDIDDVLLGAALPRDHISPTKSASLWNYNP